MNAFCEGVLLSYFILFWIPLNFAIFFGNKKYRSLFETIKSLSGEITAVMCGSVIITNKIIGY